MSRPITMRHAAAVSLLLVHAAMASAQVVARDPLNRTSRARATSGLDAAMNWTQLPGCARSVSAGWGAVLWSLGCTRSDANGFQAQRWDSIAGAWAALPLSAEAIAVAPDGRSGVALRDSRLVKLMTVTSEGVARLVVAELNADGRVDASNPTIRCWRGIALSSRDIWQVTCENDGQGHPVRFGYRVAVLCEAPTKEAPCWNPGPVLRPMEGSVLRLAVTATEEADGPGAYAIAPGGSIWRAVWSGGGQVTWTPLPGCATALAAATGYQQSELWAVGCDAPDADGNRSLWRWTGSTWQPIALRAVEVTVSPTLQVYAVLANGTIWKWNRQ